MITKSQQIFNLSFHKMIRLLLGLFLYAAGIVLNVNANLGVTPWNTFHLGISQQTGISLGITMIITGVCIVLFNYFAKQKIGIGTLLNMWLLGAFVDLLMAWHLVPEVQSRVSGFVMLFLSMFVIAFATYLYIGAGYGAGPRDGLMLTFMRLTGKPVGTVRAVIEISVLIIGILLGGKIGIGTPILAILFGPICQLTFKWLHFDVNSVSHRYIEWSRN